MPAKLIQALLRLFSKIPINVNRRLGRALGRLFMTMNKKYRHIVMDNLRLAFPQQDQAWIQQTAKKCFEHLGMIVCELPYLAAAPMEQIMALSRIHGLEILQPFIDKGYKNSLVLTGHIGNWEWNGVVMGAHGLHGNLVARPLDNRAFDIVVNRWRERTGQKVVSKHISARKLLPLLRKGENLVILLDQNMDWYEGHWVNFFGQPACTNYGLALLAMHTNMLVVPTYGFRADDGCFDIYIGQPIELCSSGDRRRDVWQNTQNYTTALENIIRQKPEQWLWLHQRWKTKNYCPWPREH